MEITILFSFAVAVSMQPVSQLAPDYDGIFPNPPVIHALDSPKVERVFYSRSDCINHLKGEYLDIMLDDTFERTATGMLHDGTSEFWPPDIGYKTEYTTVPNEPVDGAANLMRHKECIEVKVPVPGLR